MFDDEGSRYCVRESKGKACIMQEHDRGFWGTELAMLIFTCVPLCKKEVHVRLKMSSITGTHILEVSLSPCDFNKNSFLCF